MYSEVHTPLPQCFLNFLGEHPLGTDFSKGNVKDLIASGFDDFDFDLMAAALKLTADVIGLPQRKL
jgi:hypothetical protein